MKTQEDLPDGDDDFASDGAAQGRKVYMFYAVLLLYLCDLRVAWQVPASQPAARTKKRSDQTRRTRAASSILPDDDDDFETVGHTPGVKVHLILYSSQYMRFAPHNFTYIIMDKYS